MKRKISKPAVIVLVLILLIAGLIVAKRIKDSGPGPYDDFAQCLTDAGAKEYGAYWCPNCKVQKDMFENSWKYISYIECSLPGGKGQTKLCNDAGIANYPTWEFADGTRVEGVQELLDLADKTNCSVSDGSVA